MGILDVSRLYHNMEHHFGTFRISERKTSDRYAGGDPRWDWWAACQSDMVWRASLPGFASSMSFSMNLAEGVSLAVPKCIYVKSLNHETERKVAPMIKLMYKLYVLSKRIRMVWRSLSQVVLKVGWPTPNTPWSGYLGIGNNCFCQETNNEIRQKCLFKHRLNLYLRLLPKHKFTGRKLARHDAMACGRWSTNETSETKTWGKSGKVRIFKCIPRLFLGNFYHFRDQK